MPEFKDLKSLNVYIEKTYLIQALNKIGEEIKGWLRNNVRLLWYERSYTSTAYSRTYELIDSISVRQAKKMPDGYYQVEIYFDTDLMNTYPASDGEWSKHESITTGTDVRLMIPAFVEWGQNSPLFSYEGVHPVQTTYEEIRDDNYLVTRMKELLGNAGFKCV
jgi:ABC-type molybdate transport system substrate-binding protein